MTDDELQEVADALRIPLANIVGALDRLRRHRRLPTFRKLGPERPQRVTDDDDDGLAGASVPKKPIDPTLIGAGAKPIP